MPASDLSISHHSPTFASTQWSPRIPTSVKTPTKRREPTLSSEGGLAISCNIDYDGASYRPMTGDTSQPDAASIVGWDKDNASPVRLRKKPEDFVPAFDSATSLSSRIDSVLDVYAEMYGEFDDEEADEDDPSHHVDVYEHYTARTPTIDLDAEAAMRTPEIARDRPIQRTSQVISSPASSVRPTAPVDRMPLEDYQPIDNTQTRPWDERGKTGLYGGGGRGADDHETGWVGAPVAATAVVAPHSALEEDLRYDDEEDEDEDYSDHAHYDDDDDDDEDYDEYVNHTTSATPRDGPRSSLSTPSGRHASLSSMGKNSLRQASVSSNRRASNKSSRSVRHPSEVDADSGGHIDYRQSSSISESISASRRRQMSQHDKLAPTEAFRQPSPLSNHVVCAMSPGLNANSLKKLDLSEPRSAKVIRPATEEKRKVPIAKIPEIHMPPKISRPLASESKSSGAVKSGKSSFRWGIRSKKAPVISNPILPDGFVESLGMETFELTPGCAAPDHRVNGVVIGAGNTSLSLEKPLLSSFVPLPSSKANKGPAPRPRKVPGQSQGPVRVGSPNLQFSSFEGVSTEDTAARLPTSPLPVSPTPVSPVGLAEAPVPPTLIPVVNGRPSIGPMRQSDVSAELSDAFHRLSRNSELSYTPSKSSSMEEAERARRADFDGLRRNTHEEVSANTNTTIAFNSTFHPVVDTSQAPTPIMNARADVNAFRNPWGAGSATHQRTFSSPSQASAPGNQYFSTPQASIGSFESTPPPPPTWNADRMNHRDSECSVYSTDGDGNGIDANNRAGGYSGYSYGSYYDQVPVEIPAVPIVPIAPLKFVKRTDSPAQAMDHGPSRPPFDARAPSEVSFKAPFTHETSYNTTSQMAGPPQWRTAPQIGTTGFRNPFG